MMKRTFFLMTLAATVLSGCSSVVVTHDYDVSADFSLLKTFAWQHADQPQTGNPRLDNDLIDERIRMAVNADFLAKGFRLVDQADADFHVAYFVDYKQRVGSSGGSMSVGVGRGGAGRYGGVGYSSASTVSDYEEGSLTIDIINPSDGKNFWRGVGRRTSYASSDPKKITKIVNQSVASILKKFPPKK